jgi:hypothetical protein
MPELHLLRRSQRRHDHRPHAPIGMFHDRRRPKGLEFASCESCNHGTRKADLVAALLGRVLPDVANADQAVELRGLLRSVSNNVPGLLEEMRIAETDQAARRSQLGISAGPGILHAGGPLVSKFMQIFAIKFGFALHYHATTSIVPLEGGVAARWFSNVDRLMGHFPQGIFKLLPQAATLRQGKVGVPDQFEYSCARAPDGSLGCYLGTFRRSFAVVAFAAKKTSLLLEAIEADVEGFRVYAPGEILT